MFLDCPSWTACHFHRFLAFRSSNIVHCHWLHDIVDLLAVGFRWTIRSFQVNYQFSSPIFTLDFVSFFVRTRILKFTDERMRITSEVFRSMRVVKMYCWEPSFKRKIISVRQLVKITDRQRETLIDWLCFRREIIQCAYRLLLDCVQTFFSHTHLTTTLLMIYLAMWSLNIRFDTRLFAILMCLVGYMRMWTIDTSNYGVRNLVHYFAARKRIEVCFNVFLIISIFFLIDDWELLEFFITSWINGRWEIGRKIR